MSYAKYVNSRAMTHCALVSIAYKCIHSLSILKKKNSLNDFKIYPINYYFIVKLKELLIVRKIHMSSNVRNLNFAWIFNERAIYIYDIATSVDIKSHKIIGISVFCCTHPVRNIVID